VWADRRFRLARGRAFALYVAGYTAGRFVIELMRTDPAPRVFGDVRINVVVSAVVFAGAVAYLFWVRGPREVFGRALDDPGSAGDDGGTPDPVARKGSTGDEDEDQRSENEAEVRLTERSPAAAPTGKGGSANASSVDAEPVDPAQEEDAPATPPSGAKS
jgi:hypothetical protein